jgi:CheY-like chemotaxis protein/HPt (histidine-containing phosphotransfer) domain-containing protein
MEVSDTGRGIKKADLDKLFNEFSQLDYDKKRDIDGVGLGLPITKAIVETMNGVIEVQSKYRKWSKFTVNIPQTFHTIEPLAFVEDKQNKNILVYERRVLFACSLRRTLENLGLSCVVIKSDDELLEKLMEREYYAIFISLHHYKLNQETINTHHRRNKIALLAELTETLNETIPDENVTFLSLPIYSATISHFLNHSIDKSNSSKNTDFIKGLLLSDSKVLVVDDINTNLMVADGILKQYDIKTDLCKSGLEALRKVKSKDYNLIFMDHRMPIMDGVETVQKIRDMGTEDQYFKTVPIVALTANAIAGTKEMFLSSGFDDLLTKPINIKQLNNLLTKYLSPNEPITPILEKTSDNLIDKLDPKLIQIFCDDTLESTKILKESLSKKDLNLFTVNAHALSSLLATIGNNHEANMASKLENAAIIKDFSFIYAHLDSFCNSVNDFIESINTNINIPEDNIVNVVEDTQFLLKQLSLVKDACEHYDDTTIYEIINVVKQKSWSSETTRVIDNIYDTIYLYSDFDKAMGLIYEYVSGVSAFERGLS